MTITSTSAPALVRWLPKALVALVAEGFD